MTTAINLYIVIGIQIIIITAVVLYRYFKSNKYLFTGHQAEIEIIIDAFLDDKYPTTGVLQSPEQLIAHCNKAKIPAKRFNKALELCVKYNILQEKTQGKKLYYSINPEYLK